MIYRGLYAAVIPLLRVFFRLFFFVRISGVENVPQTGGFIVSGNHKSNYDPLLVAAFLTRKVRFLAKRELFKFKPFGMILEGVGVVPITRGGSEIGTLKTVLSLIKEDNVFIVFPEGTRKKVDINDVKSGAVMFAIKGKVPILPVYIDGKYRLFGKTKLIFGEPIYYDEYYNVKLSQENMHDHAVELINKIYSMAEVPSDEN